MCFSSCLVVTLHVMNLATVALLHCIKDWTLPGSSLRLTGPSSGGLVSDDQPKWWSHCVGISRQIPASVGEDQGAHHPGGGTGDGEVEGRVDGQFDIYSETYTNTKFFFVSLNDSVFVLTGARSRVWGKHGQRRCACSKCSSFQLPMFDTGIWFVVYLCHLKKQFEWNHPGHWVTTNSLIRLPVYISSTVALDWC